MVETNKRHVILLAGLVLDILVRWQDEREGCRYVFNLVGEDLYLDVAGVLYKARSKAVRCINYSLVFDE